jgi:hypothetical protein
MRRQNSSAVDGSTAAIAGDIQEPVFHLYQGHFLDRDEEQPWMLGMRQKLRNKLLRHVTALGQHWEAAGQWDIPSNSINVGSKSIPWRRELYRRLAWLLT